MKINILYIFTLIPLNKFKNRSQVHLKKKKLNNWFFEHRNNSYPSETEKSQLSKLTGLDKQQIFN